MTKRDYIAIAARLADLRQPNVTADNAFGMGVNSALNATAKELCSVFSANNPAFDRARFLKACGVAA